MKSKSLIVGTSIISCILWMAAIVTLLPVSCTTAPERSVKFELSEQDQKKLTELQMETEIGRNMAGRLLAYYGNQSSEQLLKYVNRVGSFVASYSDPRPAIHVRDSQYRHDQRFRLSRGLCPG